VQQFIADLLRLPIVEALEDLAYLATALGVPWALLIYWRDLRRQREERDIGTYSSLDDKYLHYLELCLQHPELNMFVYPIKRDQPYTAEQIIQRYALFETIISVMERAYLRYYKHWSEKRKAQWPGWESYLRDWMAHPDFPELWKALASQFDAEFVEFVNKELTPSNPGPALISGATQKPKQPVRRAIKPASRTQARRTAA
jgi:hypothetical protein